MVAHKSNIVEVVKRGRRACGGAGIYYLTLTSTFCLVMCVGEIKKKGRKACSKDSYNTSLFLFFFK